MSRVTIYRKTVFRITVYSIDVKNVDPRIKNVKKRVFMKKIKSIE